MGRTKTGTVMDTKKVGGDVLHRSMEEQRAHGDHTTMSVWERSAVESSARMASGLEAEFRRE